MKLSPQQLREKYLSLPQDLKDAVSSVDVSNIISSIGQKHDLAIDEMGILADETGKIMLGLTHPNQFISNLAENLDMDKGKSHAIANDINEQVFRPVRDSLRRIHGITGEEYTPKGNSLGVGAVDHREEILKEIEKDHTQEEVPDILKGNVNPFDVKMKEEVHQAPVEERTYKEKNGEDPTSPPAPEKPKNKYTGFDPYREAVE